MTSLSALATDFLAHYGYAALFVLMALETGMILHFVPSELIVSVAAAALVHSPLSFAAVVLVSTAGASVGSLLPYGAARYGGRAFLLRHAALFHMDEGRLDRLETLFRRPLGESLVFFCRLLPFLRAFVSIPAGLARMNLGKYIVLSTLGAAVFNFALTYAGTRALHAILPTAVLARLVDVTGAHPWLSLSLAALAAVGLWALWRGRRELALAYLGESPRSLPGVALAVTLALIPLALALAFAPGMVHGLVSLATSDEAAAARLETVPPLAYVLLGLLQALTLALLGLSLARWLRQRQG
jgi:membrane protein DedA with SNARE-associated domain